MAIKFKTYWKTTPLTEEQLQQAITLCAKQDERVMLLFQTFGTLTQEDLVDLYLHLYPTSEDKPTKESSIGRSRITLLHNNVIIEAGHTMGKYNRPITLYTIVDNPPTELKTFNRIVPKHITLDLEVEDGMYVDIHKMIESLDDKLNLIMDKFGLEEKPEPKSAIPEGCVQLEYYLHELFLKENPKLTQTNVGPRVGRYMFDLLHDGIIKSWEHVRDCDYRLKTIITIGSEPTEFQTFRDKMNSIIKQERRLSKIEE